MINQVKGAVPRMLRMGQHVDRAFLQFFLNEPHGNHSHTVIGENGMLHGFRKGCFDPAANLNVIGLEIIFKKAAMQSLVILE